jgi:hypothetical protein
MDHLGPSERRQPSDKVAILAPFSRVVTSFEQRFCFGERFAFRLQIDGDIFVGGVDTRMPQPMGERAEIDPRTQQVKGRTVANRVRVKSLALERRPPQRRFLHVLIQDEADTAPGQPGAPIIEEHRSRLARR